MNDQELLLSVSNMLDKKLAPIKADMQTTKVLLETDMLPRLRTIEDCYVSTYRRYASGIGTMEALQSDMELVKEVVSAHSERLQQLA